MNISIVEIRENLLEWYKNHGRDFPWRREPVTGYQVVVSELLLQRTRAETVSAFFHSFINKYPSWEILAKASETEIGKVIQPIGLWKRRAKTMKELSLEMVMRQGKFPSSRDELEKLPGVGQYIANAILLFCHNESQPLLDVNMARVLERVFGPRKLSDIRYDRYLQELSRIIIKCENPKKINWAILDLSALICKSKKPLCGNCPLLDLCNYNDKKLFERK